MEQSIVCVNKINKRLDVFLTENLEDFTRSQIKRQIDGNGAKVNGASAKAHTLVKNGDIVTINFTRQLGLEDVLPENIELNIIYEDNDIVVINKPQGMVVHPAPGNYTHTLVNALLFHFGEISNMDTIRPGIVHRIDKDTSGLLVVAKNNNAHLFLAKQFETHEAHRTYYALLEGALKQDEGVIDTFICRDKSDRKKFAVSLSEGKRAITHYKVLERYKSYTYCSFMLETGRTHQIRVHTKYIGHPIVGDMMYGFKKQKFSLNGQLLHAGKLELIHPTTHEKMTFTAPLPDYFELMLKKVKKI